MTNPTPIKVEIGPTPKMTHFDFKMFLIFTVLIVDFIFLILLSTFIDSFPYAPSPLPTGRQASLLPQGRGWGEGIFL
jgi:hypothetical protein